MPKDTWFAFNFTLVAVCLILKKGKENATIGNLLAWMHNVISNGVLLQQCWLFILFVFSDMYLFLNSMLLSASYMVQNACEFSILLDV